MVLAGPGASSRRHELSRSRTVCPGNAQRNDDAVRPWLARRAGLVLVILCSLLTIGCFEFTEEVRINKDRSCELMWDVGVSEGIIAYEPDLPALMRRALRDAQGRLACIWGVKETFLQEYSDAGIRHFVYRVRLEDVDELGSVHDILADQAPLHSSGFGPVIKRAKGRRLVFTQVLSSRGARQAYSEFAPAPWDPEECWEEYRFERDVGLGIAALALADKYVTVRLCAPKIITANGRINEERTQVEWKFSLAQIATGRPIDAQLYAEVETPFEWRFWAPVLGGGIVLLYALLSLLRPGPGRRSGGGGQAEWQSYWPTSGSSGAT